LNNPIFIVFSSLYSLRIEIKKDSQRLALLLYNLFVEYPTSFEVGAGNFNQLFNYPFGE